MPLVPAVLSALGDYLEGCGFPRDPPAYRVGTPLIPALPDKRDIGRARREVAELGIDTTAALSALARQAGPVHPTRLYSAVKRFLDMTSALALHEDTPHARAFSEVGLHWLRHTFVSHGLADGMSLESVRNFAGHDSLETTFIYVTAEIGRQYREAETFLRRATA